MVTVRSKWASFTCPGLCKSSQYTRRYVSWRQLWGLKNHQGPWGQRPWVWVQPLFLCLVFPARSRTWPSQSRGLSVLGYTLISPHLPCGAVRTRKQDIDYDLYSAPYLEARAIGVRETMGSTVITEKQRGPWVSRAIIPPPLKLWRAKSRAQSPDTEAEVTTTPQQRGPASPEHREPQPDHFTSALSNHEETSPCCRGERLCKRTPPPQSSLGWARTPLSPWHLAVSIRTKERD